MATLAIVTKETRLILKFGGLALGLIIFIFLIFQGGVLLKNTFFPAPPAAPQEKFGKLTPIVFPQQSLGVPQFRVNTVSGTLPIFSSTIKVYKLQVLQPSITALQAAKARAASLGYTQNQQAITADEYVWTLATANNTLRYNITSLNFSVSSDYLASPSPIGNVPDKSTLLTTVGNFIGALGSNQSDVTMSNSIFSYYLVNNGTLTETPNVAAANAARVYLIQNPIDQIPIYYPGTNPSLLYFTLSGTNVVYASYIHFAPDLTSSSTYPLKTASAALADLSSGKGFIVSPTADVTVDLTDVSLGYYVGGEQNQTYLMPIVVFTGKNNFKAYVNALAD
ncbi:MAG: hypothetical protein ACHQT7_01700 [Candidatus Levyibacteriota bacterium]